MILLDPNSKTPLYRQLYQQLRMKILCGEISPKTKLISSRQRSVDLHVSRNTVDTAYQQLLAEGYVVGKARSGYYVEPVMHQVNADAALSEEEPPVMCSGTEKNTLYNFMYGSLPVDTFPFSKWQRLTNLCLREHEAEMLRYGSSMGEFGLRREIVKYLRAYRDVNCTVDQILITSGTKQCISIACQLLQSFTADIAIEDPGFQGAYFAFKAHGFGVTPVSINHHGIDVKALDAFSAKAVYITPSHQFPTGTIMSITRRLALIEWADKKDAYIIEDDYSSYLRYNVKPISSLQGLAPDRVVYVGSFSKVLLPSLRVAYMVLPKKLAEKLQQQSEYNVCSVPFLMQKPLQIFLKEGYFESHVRKMTQHLKKKHDRLVAVLHETFGDQITISGMDAGLHILLQVHCELTSEALIQRACEAGIAISENHKLWIEFTPRSDPYVLLGFGAIALDDIAPAVELLKKVWFKCNEV